MHFTCSSACSVSVTKCVCGQLLLNQIERHTHLHLSRQLDQHHLPSAPTRSKLYDELRQYTYKETTPLSYNGSTWVAVKVLPYCRFAYMHLFLERKMSPMGALEGHKCQLTHLEWVMEDQAHKCLHWPLGIHTQRAQQRRGTSCQH